MEIKEAIREQLSFFVSIPALLWQFLFLYMPILFILFLSVTQVEQMLHITLNHYRPFFSWAYGAIIMRSLALACGNALLSLLVAYPVAYFLALHIKKRKNLFLFFIILPFWTNLLVQVYAWCFVLEPYGVINTILLWTGFIMEPLRILNTPLAVFLGMLYCYVPFMVVPLYATLENLDMRLLEASADLGASSFETFRNITLPLSLPGIQTGFFLVFIPSFGEFVIPTLLGGGKTMYVGTLISYYFLIMRDVFSGSAFTVLSCIVVLGAVVGIYHALLRYVTASYKGLS